MAQSGYTPIQLYHSDTPAAIPSAGDLVDGELAINIADGKLYYKNSATSGVELLTGLSGFSGYSGSGISGFSGYSGSGSSGFSGFSGFSGSGGATVYPGVGIGVSTGSAWAASFNSSNPIPVQYGGLGVNAVTAGHVLYGLNSSATSNSANLFFDFTNTRLGVGTNSPVATLYVKGGNSNNMVVDNAGQQFTTLSWYNNGSLRAQTFYDQTNSIFVSGTDVSAAYVFKTNSVEAMRIHASRGVSVGTSTDPGVNNLLVNGSVGIGGNFKIIQESGVLNFYNGATKIMSLDASGNLITLGNMTAFGTP
jgi:hypothetical protein